MRFFATVSCLMFLAISDSAFAAKCENFINHELAKINSNSTYSRTGKCFSRNADKSGKIVTFVQTVSTKAPFNCRKEPPGYAMPGWSQYNAVAVRADESGEKTKVHTYFSIGQQHSQDTQPYVLKDLPEIVFELSADCKIDQVSMAEADGGSQPRTVWNSKDCANPPLQKDLGGRRSRALADGCALLMNNYNEFIPPASALIPASHVPATKK